MPDIVPRERTGNGLISLTEATIDSECVSSLRQLLTEAEEGKILGFAMVTLCASQEVGWSVAGKEAKCNYLRLHGLLGWLQTKMIERWERRTG